MTDLELERELYGNDSIAIKNARHMNRLAATNLEAWERTVDNYLKQRTKQYNYLKEAENKALQDSQDSTSPEVYTDFSGRVLTLGELLSPIVARRKTPISYLSIYK